MTCIPLRSVKDLVDFVDQYKPSKEVLSDVISKRWRLIAFPNSFENTEEMLTAFKNAMRSKSRPIYIGIKLTVDGYDQNNPDKHRWPSTLRGWIPTQRGGGCTHRWTQNQGLAWCECLCLLCWFDGCPTKALGEVPRKRTTYTNLGLLKEWIIGNSKMHNHNGIIAIRNQYLIQFHIHNLTHRE